MSIEERIHEALATVHDPEIHRPITDLGMVKSAEFIDGVAKIAVFLTVGACPMQDTITQRVTNAVLAVEGVVSVEVELDVMSEQQRAALKELLTGPAPTIPFQEADNTTRIFAVTSGKGGVGKSSVTVNLAVAFAQQGLRVGIIDIDVYGHSIPNMLGIDTEVTRLDDGLLMPPSKHGVKALSILPFKPGGASEPVAYRGPMLGKVLEQFLTDFYWQDCDVMLLDLPPGTGDVAMSLGQLLPNSELLIVTTPQPAAAEVSVRAGMMAKHTRQVVAGVVENMSGVVCPHCGESMNLFGEGGGERVAGHLSIELHRTIKVLSKIPFEPQLREGMDEGEPIVVSHPDSAAAQAFTQLAKDLMGQRRSLLGTSLKLSPR